MSTVHGSRPRRLFAILVALAITTSGLTVGIIAAPAIANDAGSAFYSPSSSNEFMAYSRIVRLQYSGSANGTLLGTFEHRNMDGTPTTFVIRKSTDDGATWSTLTTLSDPLTGTGHPSNQMWQPAFFEFPTSMGGYPAGTLLLQGNMAPSNNASTSFVEWRSTNGGASWTYVSNFQNGRGEGAGTWEPFMALNSAGNLVTYFSDERQNATYSQKLAHIVSTDGGATWSANPDGSTRVSPGEVNDVTSATQSDRPGMATVARTSGGTYFMSYEICGPTFNCSVHYKSSTTGDSWGSGASDLGILAQTSDGRTLNGTPYIAWTPAGGSSGELLLSGHTESAGESQQVIFVNANSGSGSWSWTPAPLVATGSGTNCSPNYSPNLLVSASGQSVRYTAASAVGTYGCSEVTGQVNVGLLPKSSSFDANDAGWSDYGGCWSVSGGAYHETCGGTGGNKAVAGNTSWGNYTLQGDVRYDSGTQAGFIVRVSNPATGTDSLNGYYVGISSTQITLGRQAYNWTALQSVTIPGGLAIGAWYHLTIQAIGCTFTVSGVPVGSTAAPTSFTYTDTGCTFTTGAVGVRDMASTASWRNVTVTAGGTTSTATAPYLAPFAGGSSSGWTNYGGTWATTTSTETYGNTTGGAGEKSVVGSTSWTNYSLSGDVQLNASTGGSPNAGLLVRVTNPSVGVDALNGYYAGVTPTSIVLGREQSGWTALASATLPVSLPVGAWYHLTVESVGCVITVTGVPSAGGSQVSMTYNDSGCTFTSGAIGVRTYNTTATWRDITVTPR